MHHELSAGMGDMGTTLVMPFFSARTTAKSTVKAAHCSCYQCSPISDVPHIHVLPSVAAFFFSSEKALGVQSDPLGALSSFANQELVLKGLTQL